MCQYFFRVLHLYCKSIIKIINHASPSGKELIKSSLISDKGQKLRGAHFLEYFSIIIQAIRENKKIKFKYFEITKGNKLVHKRAGHEYVVSPYYTVLYDNEYFLEPVHIKLLQFDNKYVIINA